jgi:hypothetical protein
MAQHLLRVFRDVAGERLQIVDLFLLELFLRQDAVRSQPMLLGVLRKRE